LNFIDQKIIFLIEKHKKTVQKRAKKRKINEDWRRVAVNGKFTLGHIQTLYKIYMKKATVFVKQKSNKKRKETSS